jgi:hypothetical protein
LNVLRESEPESSKQSQHPELHRHLSARVGHHGDS